jgi:hypothetical protein
MMMMMMMMIPSSTSAAGIKHQASGALPGLHSIPSDCFARTTTGPRKGWGLKARGAEQTSNSPGKHGSSSRPARTEAALAWRAVQVGCKAVQGGGAQRCESLAEAQQAFQG